MDLTNYLSGLEDRIAELENAGLETRMDSIEQAISNMGTVHSTDSLINITAPNATELIVCQLTLETPGIYLLYGYARGNSWGVNNDMICRFANSDRNTWHSSNYVFTNKYCSVSSHVGITSAKTIDLLILQNSGSSQTIGTCYIQAVRIK